MLEFHHPVASLWQRCLNAVDPPPVREQRDLPRGVLVRARWVWERDGEAWLDGRVMSIWRRRSYEDVVLVHRLQRDPRGQTHGEWLPARDVVRRNDVGSIDADASTPPSTQAAC